MVAQSVAPDARDRVTWRAQQEHAFLSDGVDDVANLLVVQQEIDRPEYCCLAPSSFKHYADTP